MLGDAPAAGNESRRRLTQGMQYFWGIDYHNLQKLCDISGLQNRDISHTTPEAHKMFLQLYRNIFIQPKSVLPKIPVLIASKSRKKSHIRESVNDDYLEKLQAKKNMEDTPHHLKRKVKTLIRILRKLPFHRTRSERLNTYKILKMFPVIDAQFTDQELKQLSEQLIMESWETGSTVFGNQAFYMILKGYARPYTMVDHSVKFQYFDPLLDSATKMLTLGDSFGSLVPIPNHKLSSRVLSVFTEADCEILKISIGQYKHVQKDIMLHNHAVKEELIQACPFYQQWPKLSLNKLVELIKWKKFPANYVLVKEGEISSFVGYIKSGHCYIFKNIEALMKLPLGQTRNEVKHIIMGKLQEKESFGEISILLEKPFTCTIITATKVELAVISADDLQELDPVNQKLLQQTAQPIFGTLTQRNYYACFESILLKYSGTWGYLCMKYKRKRSTTDIFFWKKRKNGRCLSKK
uniref:cyclic nucleotide-binding domain-containing protein 1 isoform X2 n=1 Tax=Pristiophorus japonicus TaxID=55135 RepID=UPI00398F85E5